MFEGLLNYVVDQKVHASIAGITRAGTELPLQRVAGISRAFSQGDAIFTVSMVKEMRFHELGCTIILASV